MPLAILTKKKLSGFLPPFRILLSAQTTQFGSSIALLSQLQINNGKRLVYIIFLIYRRMTGYVSIFNSELFSSFLFMNMRPKPYISVYFNRHQSLDIWRAPLWTMILEVFLLDLFSNMTNSKTSIYPTVLCKISNLHVDPLTSINSLSFNSFHSTN